MPEELNQYDASNLAPADMLRLVKSMNSTTAGKPAIDPGDYPAFNYEMNIEFVSSDE